MTIRREPTYLSSEVWRALWIIAKARGQRADAQGLVTSYTPDEVANELLRELIKDRHPQLFEHQKQVSKLEDALIKTLGGG
jgi:hypothetical protein